MTVDSSLLAFLQTHPQWVFASIFLIAFLESLALAGVVIPGVALLAAAAFVAGSGALSMQATLLAAFIGAVLGDGISFLLGKFFHQDIKRWRLFHRHPHWIANGEAFFKKHGVKSVVIGRFVGPIRPIIPLVAGMFDMPVARFFTFNLLSACGWAPLYTLPGFYLGAAIEPGYDPQHLLLAGALIAILLVAIYYLIRRFITPR